MILKVHAITSKNCHRSTMKRSTQLHIAGSTTLCILVLRCAINLSLDRPSLIAFLLLSIAVLSDCGLTYVVRQAIPRGMFRLVNHYSTTTNMSGKSLHCIPLRRTCQGRTCIVSVHMLSLFKESYMR